jgi:hypothetical protein
VYNGEINCHISTKISNHIRHQTSEQIISGSQPLLRDFDKNEVPTDIQTFHLHITWKANKTVKHLTATTVKVDTN